MHGLSEMHRREVDQPTGRVTQDDPAPLELVENCLDVTGGFAISEVGFGGRSIEIREIVSSELSMTIRPHPRRKVSGALENSEQFPQPREGLSSLFDRPVSRLAHRVLLEAPWL
jgi:hypothetical protein